jgi:hypothetical protein
MRLENYITHGEYLNTIELAYKVKKIYGINKNFQLKKSFMLAAFKAGTVETEGGAYLIYHL